MVLPCAIVAVWLSRRYWYCNIVHRVLLTHNGHLNLTQVYHKYPSTSYTASPKKKATMKPAPADDTNIIATIHHIIVMYLFSDNWLSPKIHIPRAIEVSWLPSTSYSHMSPWISNTASKSYNLHRSTLSFSVATCAPGDPSLVLGSNSSNFLDSNTTYNCMYSVSVTNLLLMAKAMLQFPQCFVKYN